MTKFLGRLSAVVIVISLLTGVTFAAGAQTGEILQNTCGTYFDYYNKNVNEPYPEDDIKISTENVISSENIDKAIDNVSGNKSVQLNDENSWCEWSFNVVESGNYEIWIKYYPIAKTGKDILLSLSFDGETPYNEAKNLKLSRIWKDLITTEENTFETDTEGNDIRPQQVEAPDWVETPFRDIEGLYEKPFIINLESGAHKIRFNLQRENVAVSEIILRNTKKSEDYDSYITKYTNKEIKATESIILQAENAFQKTNPILYPTYDRYNSATMPNNPTKLRLNTIGQSNWGKNGDTISWRVDVPEDGLYNLQFRARQNFNQGMSSYRTLKINGEVPFLQAENIAFPYSQDWYILTLGNETPQYVYLKKGDIISLTCTSGEMSEILRNVRKSLLDLNEIYRKIIAITSTEPDIYRSYSLDKQIPGLEEKLSDSARFLKETSDKAEKINGSRGSQVAILDYVTQILSEMAESPDTIQERLGAFKGGIDSLGSLVLTLGDQPLELDYIAFSPENSKELKANGNIFSRAGFFLKQFIGSFIEDYSAPGEKNSINVWVSTGRDQAQIIKNLIKNDFTENTGIEINLNMVDTGATLIKAALAGKGPDVALTVGIPLELACRDALVCLDDYDISDTLDQFYDNTLVPMKYNGQLYALPESENFDVMFYRTDVFNDLGLKIPNTWDEFIVVMEKLQKNNLVVGIPEINNANMGVSDGIATFDKFLLQGGGCYYNDQRTKAMFNTDMAYNAFEKWVKLYQMYGLDREYNFYSRFRTGEMPLAIHNYSSYNQLMQAAPELQGMWTMALIPGTEMPDGKIDRSESGNVIGCVMLKSAVEKGIDEQAITFMKWWTGAEAQTKYANELEATLGVAARYAAANKEVIKNLGWTQNELDILIPQMQWVKPVPQVPGNYIIPRSLTTAFRSVMNSQTSAQQALTICNISINDELERKRQEFNLE